MEKKYEFTNFSIMYKGHRLHQIRALKDFGNIKKGDIGGYIETENNLSHEGNCWVYDNAYVYENARIYENARVRNKAEIFGAAIIRSRAYIGDCAKVFCRAVVENYAIIEDKAIVRGYARIYDSAYIYGQATIQDYAIISDKAVIRDSALVQDSAEVKGESVIQGNVILKDQVVITNSHLEGNICIDNENYITNAVMFEDNFEEKIRCQTGLIPCNGEVIAYKIVNSDLTSCFDKKFQYKIGEWAVAENVDESNKSCASGLHFSNATYWDNRNPEIELYKATYLIAKIKLEDIITVQQGKIRCRKAFILGRYNVGY